MNDVSNSDPVISQLKASNIQYELVDCDPELADTAEFCEAYGYELGDSANAIVVVGKGDPKKFVMCVVLATTRLDVNKAVRKRLGAKRCSFASSEQTKELTGMEIGGVTPFGIPDSLPLWVDSRVAERERLIVGGGSRSRKFLVEPASLLKIPNSELVEELAKPAPSASTD